MIAYSVIQLLLLLLVSLATAYILVFALAGLFYKETVYSTPARHRKTAVLIPGYKEDAVIVEVAKAALQQNYATELFDVVIIADSFKKETIEQLKALPLILIEVSFEKSTKSKALNAAMAQLEQAYEIAVVLDADNIMAADFLTKINTVFDRGFIAVQGHRTAKNINNSWAVLDAVSEEINNHIFRKGHRVLGLSSAIIGSGMAFDYSFFKNMMATATAVGGFDKEIELKMLKQGVKIAYLDNAYVYDEKIQQSEVFSNQRRRWLSAQLHYFKQGFTDALQHLVTKGNVDYFDKAIQFIQPPRVLLLGAVIILSSVFITLNYLLAAATALSLWWLLVTAGCITALFVAVPRSHFNAKTLTAVMGLPKGMLLMLLSLLKIKGANKTFIHTKHTAS
jgi:cellulose synthase/poly-beta-1,6-N-acetylglucosamine synthase-like glycosyltransferase